MTSVLSSVTHWLGGTREVSPERAPVPGDSGVQVAEDPASTSEAPAVAPSEVLAGDTPGGEEEGAVAPGERNALDVDLHEVSDKAMQAAKEWGSYLYSFGKTATQQVVKSAKQLKDSVEEKTILGDFSREQSKFVSENREKKKLTEAAVPPWVGYNEEEIMRTQILGLSKEKRNFLRNPPAGVQFQFEYASSAPIAHVMLEEDPSLQAMRFELVPKQIQEEIFWRNYFYRVSLIKQSTQLTSLAQQSGSTSAKKNVKEETRDNIPKGEEKDDLAGGAGGVGVGAASTLDQEFVSDQFEGAADIDDAELEKEMHQLGMTDDRTGGKADAGEEEEEELPEWERELQAELQEYEVVDTSPPEGGGASGEDADLEQEIMREIEAEARRGAPA